MGLNGDELSSPKIIRLFSVQANRRPSYPAPANDLKGFSGTYNSTSIQFNLPEGKKSSREAVFVFVSKEDF